MQIFYQKDIYYLHNMIFTHNQNRYNKLTLKPKNKRLKKKY